MGLFEKLSERCALVKEKVTVHDIIMESVPNSILPPLFRETEKWFLKNIISSIGRKQGVK